MKTPQESLSELVADMEAYENTRRGIEHCLRLDVTEIIVVFMHEKNLNRKQMARRLRMKQPQLTRILQERSNLTLKTVSRIAKACGRQVQIIVIPPKGAK